jgi:hypothetical protein
VTSPPNVDYASWTTLAKAQATEDRLNQLTAGFSNSWILITTWANGWGNYSGRSLAVKIIDQGTACRISGEITNGTVTDGTAVFFLDNAATRPGRLECVTIGATGATVGAGSPYLEVSVGGWVNIYGGGNYNPNHWVVSGTYPLDTS